ncbi:MAG: anaerobic ribonucleoside-triphosphate reductase activating protein [Patescibacteria group bacterium]|nr:anaerobic ribonucleoside-triphosphate reductase activating protein [Patescibacteria group bacterium]
MKIGGLQKLTLIDYPGSVACTVFLSGCNFRCPWCYSAELVLPEKIENQVEIEQKEFFKFLERREKTLDGVVICGGEATTNPSLPEFARKIKEMGFKVKLDTNGSNPQMLNRLLKEKLLDYIAMDVKNSFEKYSETVGVDCDIEKIKKSIDLIKNSGIDYEFRTTLVPGIHTEEDIEKIGKAVKSAEKYFLQNFLPEKTIYGGFVEKTPFTKEQLEKFKEKVSPFVKKCEIRS